MRLDADPARAALHDRHRARPVMPNRLAGQCSSPPRRTRRSRPPEMYTNATSILMSG
jgi:hypothetical protein